jgi:hypothetical protein
MNVPCEGWWEQQHFGRQPMHELTISLLDGHLRGQGRDIIGPFTLTGQVVQCQVAILKRYLGQHSVEYYGTYDGEGTFAGHWRIDAAEGRWLIKLVREKSKSNTATAEIQELH